jgi:P4 family phage/plasmid primase-like protien
MKQCSTCFSVKSLSSFHSETGRNDGLNPRCKDCRAGREPFKSPLELAQALHLAGIYVVPIRLDGSKAPAVSEWGHRPHTDDEILALFRKPCGIAAVGGAISGGLECLDFDEPGFYELFCSALEAAGEIDLLKKVVITKTPTTGRFHIFFRSSSPGKNQHLAKRLTGGAAIETRGEGGYFILPGSPVSVHPTLNPYRLVSGDLVNIPTITDEDREVFFSFARSLSQERVTDDVKKMAKKSASARQKSRFRVEVNEKKDIPTMLEEHGWREVKPGYWCRSGKSRGISATYGVVAPGVLMVFSSSANIPAGGHDAFSVWLHLSFGGDVNKLKAAAIKDGLVSEQAQTEDTPYFQDGRFIPLVFVQSLNIDGDFIVSGGKVYIWEDGLFKEDVGREKTVKKILEKLGNAATGNRIREALFFLECNYSIPVSELNKYKALLNLKNGMFSIRDRVLHEHDRKYRSTIRIPITYDPSKECPTVKKYLETTLGDDGAQIPLAEEIFAYCLIPENFLHRAFMLTGQGENGKSVFLDWLQKFVGVENCTSVSLQKFSDDPFSRTAIIGKLVNFFADIPSYPVKDTSFVKAAISGDSVQERGLRQEPVVFRPFTKFIFSANAIPRSHDKTFGFLKRWIILPFLKDFTNDPNRDGRICQKMTTEDEKSGWFNWVIPAMERLLKTEKFSVSKINTDAKDEWQQDNDQTAWFLAEECVFGAGFSCSRAVLYDAYSAFCDHESIPKANRREFYRRVKNVTGVKEDTNPHSRLFWGITIKGGK